jgi:protein-tyrosine phosphatase
VNDGQWGASEIIPLLYVGDLQDAQKFNGMIISVLPDWLEAEPTHAVWMPFLKNGLATLESTAALIDHALRLELRVLVHCEEGCERAPLTVAWFLHRRRAMSLDAAYTLIKRQRPIIEDRRRWLGIYNR